MEPSSFNCPIGFRLVPTDEVAVEWYLKPKNDGLPHSCDIIPEYDIYSCLPEQLPRGHQYGKRNEFYFFVRADGAKSRKVVPVKDVSNYYWRATGRAKMIKIKETTAKKMNLVLKKKGSEKTKTNWMMHEYSLVNPSSSTGHVSKRKKGFVFCRIYWKESRDKKNATLEGDAASPALKDFCRSDEDLPPSPVEIPSDPAASIQDSSGFFWRLEDLEAFLDVFSESNAAPAVGSSDFHSNNEYLTASLPEIPSERAAADPGSPDFSWKEEDLAALLAG